METVPRTFALAGLIALLALMAAAAPAGARAGPEPTVDIQSVAGLTHDGRSIGVQVLASCPEQGQVMRAGTYVPICDGSPHTFTVRVEASQDLYQTGIAQALTCANVEYAGEVFYGIDDDGSLDIVS